jgi:hypothetical protein
MMWTLAIIITIAWLLWIVASLLSLEADKRQMKRLPDAGVSILPVIPVFPMLLFGIAWVIDRYALPWGTRIIGGVHLLLIAIYTIGIIQEVLRIRSASDHLLSEGIAMQRLIRPAIAIALLLVLKSSAIAADSPTPPKPNILFLIADDLGWADVGWHGGKPKTPVMDKLVKEGVELDRHYVQPVCSPTRTALMSGRWTSRWGPHVLSPTNLRAFPPGTTTFAVRAEAVRLLDAPGRQVAPGVGAGVGAVELRLRSQLRLPARRGRSVDA